MIKEILASQRPELTQAQLDQFEEYFRMLVNWNERVNLTAIIEPEDVAKKHFVDSLAAAPYLPQGAKVVDVGTGAGFPGLPLLIIRPDLKLKLMDSLQKRLTFLEAVLSELGLKAECVHDRAEDAGQDPRYREKFDVALSRAVSSLPVLAELTLPLVKVGGCSIAYKADAKEEIESSRNALHLLHASAERIPVASDYGARELILMKKAAPTPKTYPRKAGTPSKKPL